MLTIDEWIAHLGEITESLDWWRKYPEVYDKANRLRDELVHLKLQ